MTPDRLTPEEARARFGELLAGPARTYASFTEDEAAGEWRPEFERVGGKLVLSGYRLWPPVRTAKTRAPFRRQPK